MHFPTMAFLPVGATLLLGDWDLAGVEDPIFGGGQVELFYFEAVTMVTLLSLDPIITHLITK